MIGNRNMFVDFDQKIYSEVKLGDRKLQIVEGKGTINCNLH